MKIVVAGGTGKVGQDIVGRFIDDGHDVVMLSRKSSPTSVRAVTCDGKNSGEWVGAFPTRLLESGFIFQFPVWQYAATDLCKQVRSQTAS
jgi:NAD dependent epimerase/dehydratase family enzyme